MSDFPFFTGAAGAKQPDVTKAPSAVTESNTISTFLQDNHYLLTKADRVLSTMPSTTPSGMSEEGSIGVIAAVSSLFVAMLVVYAYFKCKQNKTSEPNEVVPTSTTTSSPV